MVAKAAFAQDKGAGTKHITLHFLTHRLPAGIWWKNNKPQNYDECSQKGEAAANLYKLHAYDP